MPTSNIAANRAPRGMLCHHGNIAANEQADPTIAASHHQLCPISKPTPAPTRKSDESAQTTANSLPPTPLNVTPPENIQA